MSGQYDIFEEYNRCEKTIINMIVIGILRRENLFTHQPAYHRNHGATQKRSRHNQNDASIKTFLVAKADKSHAKET